MTNLIGLALVILSHSITTNYVTNTVQQSCKEVGCTNWNWVELQVEVEPGEYTTVTNIFGQTLENVQIKAPKYEMRKEKLIDHFHCKPVLVAELCIESFIIGVGTNALFTVFSQTSLEGNGQCGTYWREGTLITREVASLEGNGQCGTYWREGTLITREVAK
jgi:hypothetical protein